MLIVNGRAFDALAQSTSLEAMVEPLTSEQLRTGIKFFARSARQHREDHLHNLTARLRVSAMVNELQRRGELPTLEELQVAWDHACASGVLDPNNPPWSLLELWIDYGIINDHP